MSYICAQIDREIDKKLGYHKMLYELTFSFRDDQQSIY